MMPMVRTQIQLDEHQLPESGSSARRRVDRSGGVRTCHALLLAADKRNVSLTDWTSFEVMRDRGIDLAFAFDPGFAAQGFDVLS